MATNTQTKNGCASAQTGFAERPRFFPRQMITPDDLTLGQDYFRNKMRRHNRLLHGWGVVCGATVDQPAQPQPWKVIINSGYILGPYGDEIMISAQTCFDLRKKCITGVSGGDACGDVVDPWCGDVVQQVDVAGPLYVAVKYQEIPSRPVRVQPLGCGCDEAQCEYSRWQDGYEICVLTACPDSHKTPPDLQALLTPGAIPLCPDCPSDPWVVLATVTVDAKGTVGTIDNCSCRRMVLTLADAWWRCNDKPNADREVPVIPVKPK